MKIEAKPLGTSFSEVTQTVSTNVALEDLVTQYKTNPKMPEREKAALEERIWEHADHDTRQKYRREQYIGGLLGIHSYYQFHQRQVLHNAGKVSEPLWERIEQNGMAMGAAVRLFRESKLLAAKKGISKDKALQDALSKYDQLAISHSSTGGVFRKRTTSNLPDLEKEREKLKLRLKKQVEPESFWIKMRQEGAAFLAPRFRGIEGSVADELWRTIERDMKALFVEFQSRIERAKRTSRDDSQKLVSRRDILDACRVLGIDPPKRGQSIDLKLAQKQKRNLVREYHPDLARGDGGDGSEGGPSANSREKLEDAIKAFHVLESYAQQIRQVTAGNKASN